MLELNKTYVLFVPPSWLISGTAAKIHDGVVFLKDCTYLESVASGHSPVGSLALETDPKNLTKIITQCHPMPDGTVIRLDGILIAIPCRISMQPLARSREADAIRSAAGGKK